MIDYKYIPGWIKFKAFVYKDNIWDFIRFMYPDDEYSVSKLLNTHFNIKNVDSNIEMVIEEVENLNWITNERLFVKFKYKFFDPNEILKSHTEEFHIKKDYDFFIKRNSFKGSDFIKWCIWAASFEGNIDFRQNIWNYFNKFKRFNNNDLMPGEFFEVFNNKVKALSSGNTVSLETSISIQKYYNFMTHPIVEEAGGYWTLIRLFYVIERSDFLQGKGQWKSWNPSFNKYFDNLEKILYGEYNCGLDKELSALRRLTETESRIVDETGKVTLLEDCMIPDDIIDEFALVHYDKKEKKIIPTTEEELKSYEKFMIDEDASTDIGKKSSEIEDIKKSSKDLNT